MTSITSRLTIARVASVLGLVLVAGCKAGTPAASPTPAAATLQTDEQKTIYTLAEAAEALADMEALAVVKAVIGP